MSDENNPYNRFYNQFDKVKSDLKDHCPDYERLLDYATHAVIQLHAAKYIYQKFTDSKFVWDILVGDKNKKGLEELDNHFKHNPIYHEFMRRESHKNKIHHKFPNAKRHKENNFYENYVTSDWEKDLARWLNYKDTANYYYFKIEGMLAEKNYRPQPIIKS